MRVFFGKEGVIVPVAALTALLPAHAAKAAPSPVIAAVAQIVTGTTAAPISQITEGVINAMKIANMKTLAGATALAQTATVATYGVVRGAAPTAKTTSASTTAPALPANLTGADLHKMTADAVAPTQYRTVALTGRVRLLNGKGAGGVHVLAQLQDAYMAKMSGSNSGLPRRPRLRKRKA